MTGGLLPFLVVGSQLLIIMVFVLFIGLAAPDREEKSDPPPLSEEFAESMGHLRDLGDRL